MKNLYVTLLLLIGMAASGCSGKLNEAPAEQEALKPSEPTAVALEEPVFQPFKARNGVAFTYLKLLPENYQADRAYPAMLVFPAMEQHSDKAKWLVKKLFAKSHNQDWIVIVVDAPKDGKYGWMNHPAHHALNDLMDKIKEEHSIEQDRFHFLGYEEGSRPAFSFAGMSRSYVQSLSFVGVKDWGNMDERGLKHAEGLQMPILVFANGSDESLLAKTRAIAEELKQRKANILLLVKQEDREDLGSLQAGGLLREASKVLLNHH
ncbi:MAG: hypothetical protein HRU41_32100 [Saprospiraceae bacterium]|nr:hypothetical protein [Saprospiraceae bacterium]